METARLCGKHIARIEGTFCFSFRLQNQVFTLGAAHILFECFEFSGNQSPRSRIKGKFDQFVFQDNRFQHICCDRESFLHRCCFFFNRFHSGFCSGGCCFLHDRFFLNSRNNICGFFRFLLTNRILIFQLLHFLLLELFRLLRLILRIQVEPTRHDQCGNHQNNDRFFVKFHFFFSFMSFGGTGS